MLFMVEVGTATSTSGLLREASQVRANGRRGEAVQKSDDPMMESIEARVLIVSMLLSQQALASEPMFPKLYEITTEIGMTHLEENLRYVTTREIPCLTG